MVTRWSAFAAAVALFVGLGLLGDTPDTRDSTGHVAGYFVAHSGSVLAGAVLIGVAAAALLVFAKPIFELTLAATPVIALPLALLVGSTGFAAFAAHRRFAVASLVLAGLMMVASASFAARGYFSPDVQQQVVFQGILIWLVAAGFVIVSPHDQAARHRTDCDRRARGVLLRPPSDRVPAP